MRQKETALVTGAARGIGRAIAAELVSLGYDVVLCDRDAEGAASAAEALSRDGSEVLGFGLDIRDRAALRAVLDGLARPPAVLVNNAGIFSDRPFMELTEADFEAMLSVNLIGTAICSQEALRHMPDGGRIVHVASRAILGQRNNAHYAASKSALLGLTRTMAMELVGRGITVNAVAPGLIDTPILDGLTPERREELRRLQPSGRLGEPEDVAHAVGFLVSPRSGFITGQFLLVDGGKSLTGGVII